MEENEVNVDELEKDEPVTETDEKADKIFSQLDFDKQVKARLSRQKDKFDKELNSFKTQSEELQAQVEKYEAILSKQLESQLELVPEPVKKILQKLDISEQLEWFADPQNKIQFKKTPKTPNPLETEETTVVKKTDYGRMV